MPIYVYFASIAFAVSVPLLWWAVGSARGTSQAVARNLAGGVTPISDLRQIALGRSMTDRAVLPAVRTVAGWAQKLTPTAWVRNLEHRITLAGEQGRWPIERLLALKLTLGLIGAAGSLVLIGARLAPLPILAAGTFGIVGYFLPDLFFRAKASERQKLIRLALPDTIDQITISVEAGLGFDSALDRVGRAGNGPLAEELIRTLQEIHVGVPRDDALRNLVVRTDVGELRHFVFAIIQAENYGIPIADALRVQSGELREKRRQAAEERALKIPVKLVFPLLFCIFPTLFVVLVGPATIRIVRMLLEVT